MTINSLACLNQLASYFNVPSGKLTLGEDSIPVRTINANKNVGFLNIVAAFLSESKSWLNAVTPSEKAELRQWLEYVLLYVFKTQNSQHIQQIFKELDEVLALKTYLVSHRLTAADLILYYSLYSILANLSYLEKEKYLNLCRWFDNIQQDTAIRQSNKLVTFSTNYLACIIPSRH